MPEQETKAMETSEPVESGAAIAAGAEVAEAPAKPKRKAKAAPKSQPKSADPLDVPLFDSAGALQGEVRLPKVIFAEKVNTPVMHQAYVRQANNARQGTASTKTRATVS